MSKILGVSCFYHDAAVASLDDGRITFAIHEERLSRCKHDASLPRLAISAALAHNGWRAADVDRVVFYEDPGLKLRRLEDQAKRFWPESRLLREVGIPGYLKNKYPVADFLRQEFGFRDVVTGNHHQSHAASSFYTSPFENALVLTLDGVGEAESAAVFLGQGNRLERVLSINFPDSLGLFYSVFTQYLGFEVNEGEYKVMGLAPYGKPTMLNRILGKILLLEEDGTFRLNLDFFNFCDIERHYRDRLIDHLGVPPRSSQEAMTQAHCDLAASVQQALEMAASNLLGAMLKRYPTKNVCLAGGVALNCTCNARLIREFGIQMYIHPAAGDAGGALGAALYEAAQAMPEGSVLRPEFTPYLGVSFGSPAIEQTLRERGVAFSRPSNTAAHLARRLANGDVVAIVHGRDEWGPRALGARSILADPRRAEMKDHLNAKIKFREEFRPFAPVVMEQHYGEYFETLGMAASPYMLYTHKALRPQETAAVVHADLTSRVQTVNEEQNGYLYAILREFEALTRVPVLINTSFNLRGEPIVSSPADALKTFYASGIDCLAIEDFIVEKP
ncbi:MAG: carbamoyltransferase N-terminal domain-containing protein [Candidatus Solibacter sp.]